MKKILITILAVIVLACALVMTASAASYAPAAEQLNALGLFRGTDAGFELDRAPTRAEAVTMLVRFLGLEEESETGDYTHPFSDVPKWADNAVAIAFEKGYTTGVTDTKFDPYGTCSAQMYVTFILRALGYSDDSVGSTLWAEAIEFGKQVGIVDDIILSGTFLRGNMTAVSYLALIAAPVDGEFDTLLEKLAANGAVDETNAQLVAIWLDNLNQLEQIGAVLQDETNFAMTLSMTAKTGETVDGSMDMDMSMIIDGTKMELAMVMEAFAMDEEVTAEMYMTGGYIYISSDGQKLKIPLDAAMGDLGDIMAMAEMTNMINPSLTPPYLVSNIKISTHDDLATFSVVASGSSLSASLMDEVFASFGIDSGLAGLSESPDGTVVMTYTADGDGIPTKMGITMSKDVDADGTPVTKTVTIEIVFKAIGEDVKIDFPSDLNTYIDLDAMMAALGGIS